MDRIEYYNDLMVRLEELFYHELSDCAAWKTEMIGVDFIQARISGEITLRRSLKAVSKK